MASRIVLPFALPSCLQLDLSPATWLSHHLRGGVPPLNRPLGSLARALSPLPPLLAPSAHSGPPRGSFISCLPTSGLSELVVNYEAGDPRFLSAIFQAGQLQSRSRTAARTPPPRPATPARCTGSWEEIPGKGVPPRSSPRGRSFLRAWEGWAKGQQSRQPRGACFWPCRTLSSEALRRIGLWVGTVSPALASRGKKLLERASLPPEDGFKSPPLCLQICIP